MDDLKNLEDVLEMLRVQEQMQEILLLCLGTIIKYVQKGQADEISVFVVLVELAFTFSFADEIKDLCKMNLLLIVFLVFVVYRVIRISMMKKMSNEDIIR